MTAIRNLGPFLVVLLISSTCLAQDGFRHWTTSNGRQSDTRLKLIDSKSGDVRLQREDNNKVITMKLTMLSAADRNFVRGAMRDADRSAAGTSSNGLSAGDWPQWRGPNRDGKSLATGLIDRWPAGGPQLAWNIDGLGEGYSTPAVTKNAVYVLGAQGGQEFIFALSAENGNKLWQAPIGSKSGGGGFQGPKGTPTVDADRLYALGSDGTLVCVKREGGQTVWKKNLRSDFAGNVGQWDYAESPLIDNEKLICTPGGNSALVAINKRTGAIIWKSPVAQFTGSDFAKAGYASAIAATIAGTHQYIAFLNGGVVGVDAESGAPLWHYDSPANGTANCSTPVVQGDSVFAASAYGTGGGLARIGRQGRTWNVNERYFVNKMQNHHGGFVVHEGHIYGTNDSVLMCIDWNTGRIKWQERSVGKGSTIFANGNLYVRGEKGGVALVAASANGYQEKGRFDQPQRSGKNAWAHPVVAGGKLYLHDQERLLVYSIAE